MKSFLANLSSFFKMIDLFGVPNSLVFGNSTVYKSKFSGFVSFWVYLFLIVMISLEIKKIHDKENAIVKLLTMQSGLPDEINLKRETIMPAFRLNYPNYYTHQFMKIEIEYIQRSFLSNGSQIQVIKKIPIEQCTLSHFISSQKPYDVDTLEVEADLLKQNITEWLCPKVSTDVNISGTFGKDYFNYIKIRFLACINQTYYDANSTNEFNPRCSSSQKDFDDVFNKGKSIEINFLHVNYLITPDELQKPSKKYIDSSMYFRFNPKMQKIQSDFFFRKYFITDFDDFFKPQESTTHLFIMKDNFDYRDQVSYFCTQIFDKINLIAEKQVSNSQELATIYLRRSPFTHNAKRIFTDLGTILSFVGGLISCLITIGDMIMGQYNHISFLKTIVNNCYGFVDQVNLESYDETVKQIEQFSKGKNKQSYFLNNLIVMRQFLQNDTILQNKNANSNPLSLPMCEKIRRQEKKQAIEIRNQTSVYQIGMEMIKQDFNALRILRAIHDIERIKNILLTDEQKQIFNKLPNPVVVIDPSKQDTKTGEKLLLLKTSKKTRIIPDYFNEMFIGLVNVSLSGVVSQFQKNFFEIQSQAEFYKSVVKFLEEDHDYNNANIEFQVSQKLLQLIDQKQLQYFHVLESNKQLLNKLKVRKSQEFIYPIISEFGLENDVSNLSGLEYDFLENKTTKWTTRPEQLLNDQQSLSMILVGNGNLLKNDQMEISFLKTKDIQKQQMMLIIYIKNLKNQIEKIEITKRSSKVLDIAINKSSFYNPFEINDFQIYLTLQLNSIYQKLIEMDKKSVIDWLIKNKLTIELLIIKKFSQQLIQIPFYNILEQFFSDDNTKTQNISDTFQSIIKKKEICLKYIGAKQEEIELTFKPPQKIKVNPIQVDRQTQIIIRFFISIIKEQFNHI